MSAIPSLESLAANHGAFHEIPVIDFADAFSKDFDKRQKLARKIYDACVRVGFFYVKNHGVDESVMKDVFSAAKQFFELPLEDKMAIDLNKSPHFRGYTKLMVSPLIPIHPNV
jgi:isopenicillin N synthase-like dioxygenase